MLFPAKIDVKYSKYRQTSLVSVHNRYRNHHFSIGVLLVLPYLTPAFRSFTPYKRMYFEYIQAIRKMDRRRNRGAVRAALGYCIRDHHAEEGQYQRNGPHTNQ